MNDPTGHEHETPVEIESVSATERGLFRKCRRQWFLTSVHRLARTEGNLNFWLGTLVHSGLEAFYRWRKDHPEVGPYDSAGLDPGIQVALDAYEAAYVEAVKPVEEYLGFLWPRVEATYREAGELGFDMLSGYFEREKLNPLFQEIVDVELRLYVDITDPYTGEVVGKLTVQPDAVGRNHGRLGVADHKTASREMASSQLDLDDQLSAEAFTVGEHYAEFPDEVIYNVLYKKAPRPPKQLAPTKTGKVRLSKDMSQGATYALYRQEIATLGLDEADYADVLEKLKDQEDSDESPFFRREATFRTPAQITAFGRDLFFEFVDMRLTAQEPARAYPSPSVFSCPSCPVRLVCTTIQDDGDVESIIKAGYFVGDARR